MTSSPMPMPLSAGNAEWFGLISFGRIAVRLGFVEQVVKEFDDIVTLMRARLMFRPMLAGAARRGNA
jgi:hypothetical protein